MRPVSRAILLLSAALFLFSGCASGWMGLGNGEKSLTMPGLASIATPERAEEAVFIAVKVYEQTMGVLNRAYQRGELSEAAHAKVIDRANTFRSGALAAWKAVETWRALGSRAEFDSRWADVGADLTLLKTDGGLQ